MGFHKKWFESLQGDDLNQRFAIDTPDLGCIGLSSLMNIDWRNNRAWHGVMLGDVDTRGKGYGFDAVMATMRYAKTSNCWELITMVPLPNFWSYLSMYYGKTIPAFLMSGPPYRNHLETQLIP